MIDIGLLKEVVNRLSDEDQKLWNVFLDKDEQWLEDNNDDLCRLAYIMLGELNE